MINCSDIKDNNNKNNNSNSNTKINGLIKTRNQ